MLEIRPVPSTALAVLVPGSLAPATSAAAPRVQKITNVENAYPSFSPDGRDPVNLTRNPAGDSHPYWSRDGSRIVFNSTRDDGENDEVYVMNAGGSGLRRVVESPYTDVRPSWAPDGKRIVFNREREGTIDLYVVELD